LFVEVMQTMSAEVAGLLGGVIGGIFALLGVWLGPVVQRRSKRRGHVRYRLSDFTWEDKEHPGVYTFYIKVFNEREHGTGIRDVDVRFYEDKKKQPVITDRPKHTDEEAYHVDYMNFPAQEWTVRKLKAGDIVDRPDELQTAKRAEARIVVRPPGNEEYEINIAQKGNTAVEQIIPGTQH
jgi:hypothetical protein